MCKLKKPISLVVFFKGTFSVWQVRVHSGMKGQQKLSFSRDFRKIYEIPTINSTYTVNYFPAFYSHMVGLPSVSSVS